MRGLLALVLPGSGQLFQGKTGRGLLLLVLWFGLLISAAPDLLPSGESGALRLSTDLLFAGEVPTRFDPHPGRYLAVLLLPLAWLAGHWPRRRREEI